jgi:hypothetical protein
MFQIAPTGTSGAAGIWTVVRIDTWKLVFHACLLYYRALWLIFVTKGSYEDMRKLFGASKAKERMSAEEEHRLFAAIWLHQIGLNFELWSKPHYRADSLQVDLIANFSNIAFPGTGISMGWVCRSKMLAMLYLFVCHPIVIFFASIFITRSAIHCNDRVFGGVFCEELLCPKHWFALWRINSTLVAKHHNAHEDTPVVQKEYNYENKWDFLELALKETKSTQKQSFKVTPIISHVQEMVCKHKNIEGGMGIHMFKNAVHGGDWILQERLYNCDELQALLPADAPLSTFRVLTMIDPTAESSQKAYKAMTFVFRAGRAGKDTDHSSVLYAVDPDTLKILDGKMFSNWYQVGKAGFSNLLSKQQLQLHPDTQQELCGKKLTCAKDAVKMCVDAHRELMPNVPTIGWDVAVAKGHGPVLLEANLSCNFFGGKFDRQLYLRIVDAYFSSGCKPGVQGKKD